MKLITIYSSHGEGLFLASTGQLVLDQFDQGDMPLARRPVRLDVAEFARAYPGESPEDNGDILDWGYWLASGEYVPPCDAYREDCARERMAGRAMAPDVPPADVLPRDTFADTYCAGVRDDN